MLKKNAHGTPVEQRRLRPLPFALWGITGLACTIITYNAMVLQPADASRNMQTASTDAERTDIAQDPRQMTIRLKYDRRVEDIQRELLALGQYKGLVDGIMGERTRQAIVAYQTRTGAEPDGKVTSELLERIRYTRKIADASSFTSSTVNLTVAKKSGATPDGESARVMMVQSALSDLGYDPGVINGELTDATRAAILKYEVDNHMQQNGTITQDLLRQISKTTGYENILQH